jgi:hypothetical protein
VDAFTKRRPFANRVTPPAERRRIGTVVHDDRGNASLRWRDAPADHERPVLQVLNEPALAIRNDETYDPYARRTLRAGGGSGGGGGTRTDLRRLSEWIKMMRELEARKRNGDAED